MIYDLVPENAPILKTRIAEWLFESFPEMAMTVHRDNVKMVERLRETMNHHAAVGLAANQCGLGVRVFVCQDRYAVFNPEIISSSEDCGTDEEGCLSFPDLWMKIKRPNEITVKYQNIDGDTVTETVRGFLARLFQHEIDHLNGLTIFDRASRYHRDLAVKNREKLWKKRQKK